MFSERIFGNFNDCLKLATYIATLITTFEKNLNVY